MYACMYAYVRMCVCMHMCVCRSASMSMYLLCKDVELRNPVQRHQKEEIHVSNAFELTKHVLEHEIVPNVYDLCMLAWEYVYG